MGARVLLGAKRIEHRGNFYAPTVLTDIPKDSPARREELFGPVATLFRVRGIEQAVALANDTDFGLGSSCWTADPRERQYFIRNIEAGLAFINGMVASDPRVPFGGVKQSGSGLPEGVVQIVHGFGEEAGDALVRHPDVPVITFTGSRETASW